MGPGPRSTARQEEYLSYLLRLWQESSDEPVELEEAPVWRASLTSPTTGERLGFATIDELFGYLQMQMGRVPGTDGGHEGGD